MADIILLLEDKEEIIVGFQQWLEDSGLDAELSVCRTYQEYSARISDPTFKSRVKCMIMDLSNTPEEDQSREFRAVEYIESEYNNNRIPIFVHSGYLENFTNLQDKGTVFKIPKGKNSTKAIGDKIELMYESGFINIFCCGGRLEHSIMDKIHSAFIEQFKGNEIEEIIRSIKKVSGENLIARTDEVFERLALRAVYQNAISNKGNQQPVKVNSIEHYYRRNNLDVMPFYTGDVFEIANRESDSPAMVVVVTPRCNVANSNYYMLLVCKVNALNAEQLKPLLHPNKGVDNLRNHITDNAKSERVRFLPKTPQFVGGIVDFMTCYTISPETLAQSGSYLISLVDDLTNDVVRKLSAYLLRGGISDTAYEEAHYYFQEIQQ